MASFKLLLQAVIRLLTRRQRAASHNFENFRCGRELLWIWVKLIDSQARKVRAGRFPKL